MDWDNLFVILTAWRAYEATGRATFPVYVTLGTQKLQVNITATKGADGKPAFTFALSF